jgi:nitrite reductase/ring-hydroxylating ferredoxin subunit/uncharacterized membrane protein
MRSAAQIQGHPIHPMLVGFPIAFLFGCFAFDLAGRLGGWPSAWGTGAYLSLAAVGTGLLAAVPGLIDYLRTVPPRSSGKKRATQHALVNGSALTACLVGWAFRDWGTLEPGWATVALEAASVGLVTWGGWLGGTLAYRNQIGVDHRYADAGKWREQAVDAAPGEWVVVASADELKVNQMKLVRAGDRRIVLARTEDGYVAFDDRCPHRGGSLADGVMAECVVTCPWHGSQFDARTGQRKSGPAEGGIFTYAVEHTGAEVRLLVPAAQGDAYPAKPAAASR